MARSRGYGPVFAAANSNTVNGLCWWNRIEWLAWFPANGCLYVPKNVPTLLDIVYPSYYHQSAVVQSNVVATTGAQTLIDRVSSYLPKESTELVAEAYSYADDCHQGQTRKSGAPV